MQSTHGEITLAQATGRTIGGMGLDARLELEEQRTPLSTKEHRTAFSRTPNGVFQGFQARLEGCIGGRHDTGDRRTAEDLRTPFQPDPSNSAMKCNHRPPSRDRRQI